MPLSKAWSQVNTEKTYTSNDLCIITELVYFPINGADFCGLIIRLWINSAQTDVSLLHMRAQQLASENAITGAPSCVLSIRPAN